MSRTPSLALLFFTTVTLFQLPAVADTYQILQLSTDAKIFPYGIDDNEGQTRGPKGIFNGPDPVADLVAGGIPEPGQNFIAENSFGDVIYDDSFGENIVEAVDLTTHGVPEPGGILLVGTGILAAISNRRRLFR